MLLLSAMANTPQTKPEKSNWYVYIVRCADNTLYTGISTNLSDRIATHNSGRGAKYTRARLPVSLVYSETALDRSSAQQREHAIKKLSTKKKKALVASY
ncbi:MAG: GIY-YIG nuclease family protein [Gammaproteobacteria bacterium]